MAWGKINQMQQMAQNMNCQLSDEKDIHELAVKYYGNYYSGMFGRVVSFEQAKQLMGLEEANGSLEAIKAGIRQNGRDWFLCNYGR